MESTSATQSTLLPWICHGTHGKRNQVVGDNNVGVRVGRIRQRETERAARGLAVSAIEIAERIGHGGGDHGYINVHFAILNRLPASAVRAKNAHVAHLECDGAIRNQQCERDLVQVLGLERAALEGLGPGLGDL
jgi:LmbE family N-acetylglucosaminyl deacetylase